MSYIKINIYTLLISLLTSILFTSTLTAQDDNVTEGDTFFFGFGLGYFSIVDNLRTIQMEGLDGSTFAFENTKNPGIHAGAQISFGKKYSDNFAFELSLTSINGRTERFYDQSCNDASDNTIEECVGDLNFEIKSGDLVFMQFLPSSDSVRFYYGLGFAYTYYKKRLLLSGNGVSQVSYSAENSKLGIVGKLGLQLNQSYDFSFILYPHIGRKETVGQGYVVGAVFKYTIWE